jgi:hypothetical protein
MTLGIFADDKETTLELSVVGKNADESIHDPGHRADVESPEPVEYLFIGPPPGAPRRRAQHAAGLSVVAAAALAVWLLAANSSTTPVRQRSSQIPQRRSKECWCRVKRAPEGTRALLTPWPHTLSSARTTQSSAFRRRPQRCATSVMSGSARTTPLCAQLRDLTSH